MPAGWYAAGGSAAHCMEPSPCSSPAPPAQLVLECAAEAVLQDWLQRIQAAIAQQARRQVHAAPAWPGRGQLQARRCRLLLAAVVDGCSVGALGGQAECTWAHFSQPRDHPAACLQPPLPRRPRRLLVFVNPFGGARRGCSIWETVVRPVFASAGISVHAVQTQHGGHARAMLTSAWGALGRSEWAVGGQWSGQWGRQGKAGQDPFGFWPLR